MEEIKICVDEHGVLTALLPDGHYSRILVDLPNPAYYGALIVESAPIIHVNEDRGK